MAAQKDKNGAQGQPESERAKYISKSCSVNIEMLSVPHLREYVPSADKNVRNLRPSGSPFSTYISDTDVVLGDIVRPKLMKNLSEQEPPMRLVSYLRAGPRESTFHDPSASRAAIVTCGGLCPGMNDVICAITKTLHNIYGVKEVLGIRGGFHGFYKHELQPPICLTPETVNMKQHEAGTLLGAARGGFDPEKILAAIQEWEVNMVFIIGGDGTHRGAKALSDLCRSRSLAISVAGVPKTIDNDLGMIDRSFGFESAVEEAVHAIKSAKTEAKCAPNGIGIVKLMGRDSGFIAAHATISSGDVDLLLIPEMPLIIDPDSPYNIFDHLDQVIKKQGHAVVVISEGAGADHLLEEKRSSLTDAQGNQPKLPPIGVYMKRKIVEWFERKGEREVTVKYIDPSYIVSEVVHPHPDFPTATLFILILCHPVFGFLSLSLSLSLSCSLSTLIFPPKWTIRRYGVFLQTLSIADTRLC